MYSVSILLIRLLPCAIIRNSMSKKKKKKKREKELMDTDNSVAIAWERRAG